MSFCVSKDSKLQTSALQFLYHRNSTEDSNGCLETLGGVLSNLNYSWLANGSKFVIVKSKNGARVGSWDFATTLNDDTAEIIGIDEIQRPHGKEPLLAVSINCVTTGGIVCILDFIRSKVIRAIQIGEHISSLHVIGSGRDIFNLSGPLQNFDGIFAVGTVGGDVYIVDICWQLCYEGFGTLQAKDEINPCQMHIITPQDLDDIEDHKKTALHNEYHLAIHLNVVFDKTTQHFVLKEPSGADKIYVNKQEVLISALHYCSPLGSILVGYNFGAFQLWNLMRMELTYTSPICDDHVPISKFAVQEPADDPRAFCYVWAVYSSDDLTSSLLPYLVMYALCYESKEFLESYGILYENFQYCSVRFHMELGFNNQSVVNPKGGKCLRLESLVHKNFTPNSEMCIIDGSEDLISICVVIWKASCENGLFTYMSLFDLNQWYKAQLPNSLNLDECSNYMITLCVTDLIETTEENSDILDLVVNKKSINQFIGIQKLEEHYHPSSLSFDSYCLLENRCLVIQYQGIQKALLYQLQASGPVCLIRPTEIYQEIVSLGLTPLFVDIFSLRGSSHISLKDQREAILNVALEQQLMNWLCKCASEWANGSFSSAGCSLELLTSWAFRRGLVLKKNCDNMCVPLFDHSELRLDTNTANILNNCIRQIKNISFFHLFVMRNLSSHVVNTGLMMEQCHTLQMVEVYFDILQWLFNVGLLPEYLPSSFTENISENRIRAPYPVEKLMQYYKKRRSELLLLQNNRFCSKSSVLFIDNLINIECGGEQLHKEWKSDGGDGFYPPMSLQALLRTYLISNVEVWYKHAVVMYLLLDLTMSLDSTTYALAITHLIKFPSVFKLSPSLIKITQAFWQLDHGDFSTAMEQLLDPLVNQEDLKCWHHKVALKSLLIQEQHNSALLYMHVRKPPILDDEDVLCALSLFVSNNMLDEAFYLEKHYKSFFNSKEYIKHLFRECGNYRRLSSIVYRNLSEEEEEIFLQYLDDVKHPEAADLKITYFMQRSHYIEAFKTYKSCETDPSKKGLFSRLNSSTRDQIIYSYKKLLPTVSYKFIESCTSEPNPMLWKEVSRPEPMSVTVHGTEEKPEYKSSLIFTALAKAKQASNADVSNAFSLMNATTEEIPFLRTPTLPLSRKRMSVQVIIPKVIIEDEADGPSPRKRPKLSPKQTSLHSHSNASLETSILHTPLITRRHRREISPISKDSYSTTATPTSILKVKHSYKEESLNDLPSSNLVMESSRVTLNSEQGISSISGRKSISRTPMVRFDVPKTSTSSEEHTSSSLLLTPSIVKQTELSNNSNSLADVSKNLSNSFTSKSVSGSDDVFFSPNSSLSNVDEEIPNNVANIQPYVDTSFNEEQNDNIELNKSEINREEFSLKISPDKPAVVSEAKLVKLVDYPSSSSSIDSPRSSMTSSPSARKSYKNMPDEQTLVRSSPRLKRNQKLSNSEKEISSHKISHFITGKMDENESSTSSSNATSQGIIENRILPPVPDLSLKPRKSLCRRVMENNAFSRLSPNNMNNSITKVFHSEQKEKSAVLIDNKTTEFSFSKTEYSDVYSTQSSNTENFVEQHSKTTSFSSVKETVIDSDQDSSIGSLMNTPEQNNLVSNSFMEELVENLREQRCREINSYKMTNKQPQQEKSEKIIKENTPPRMTRALSKRLSVDRTLSSENSSNESVSKKGSRRLSEERSITSSDFSFKDTNKIVTTNPRICRSLSAERLIKDVSDSKSSPVKLSKRLSEDRSMSSSNDSQNKDQKQVEVLNFTSKSRISRRLSTEKTLTSEDCSQTSNSQTKNEDKPKQRRFSKRLTPERSFIQDSAHISDIHDEKSDILPDIDSPKISRSRSVERIDISSSQTGEPESTPQRFSKRLSVDRTLPSEINLTSGNKDNELSNLVKTTPRVKSRKSLGRQVLENNTFSRLISEYQCQEENDKSIQISPNNVMVEPVLDVTSPCPELNDNGFSLSDSLLEEIAFGKLTSEKMLLENQLRIPNEGPEDKNEQSSDVGAVVASPYLNKECLILDKERLNINEQDKSSGIAERNDVDDLGLIVEDCSKNQESSDKKECTIDEVNKESHNSTTRDEKPADLLNISEKVDNSQQSDNHVKTITENKDLNVIVTSNKEIQDEVQNNEPNEAVTAVTAANEDFSFVYAELSNERTKLNEVEINVFEISEDLSFKDSMKEKGKNSDSEVGPCNDEITQQNLKKDEDISVVQDDTALKECEMNIFEISDDSSLEEDKMEEKKNSPPSVGTALDFDTMIPTPSVLEKNITAHVSNTSEDDVPPKSTSKTSSEIVEVKSSSEDGDISSITSNSTSDKKSRTSTSSNISRTSSSSENKMPYSNITFSESKGNKVKIEHPKDENRKQVMSRQKTNENKIKINVGEEPGVSKKEPNDTNISNTKNENACLKSEQEKDSGSNLPRDSRRKRNVELQTGKSLLEIDTDDSNDIQTKSVDAVDITPSRRMTRRRSRLLEENDLPEREENISLKKSDDLSVKEGPLLLRTHHSRLSIDPGSPSQVNLKVKLPKLTSTSSSSKNIKTYCRKRTRSVDTPTVESTNESGSTSVVEKLQPARRKLRSASVDIPISLEKISEASESVAKLSPTSEQSSALNEEKRNRRKPIKTIKFERNLVKSYSSSRRLTRRQANLIETNLKEINEEVENNEIDLPTAESNERIELLNKLNFEGTPDPEEERIYETSPSSVGMSSSVSNREPARRSNRSSSNASESSIVRSKQSTHKRTRSASDSVDYSNIEEPRTRLRSNSTDAKEDLAKKIRRLKTSSQAAAVGETSDDSSTLKKSRKISKPKRYTDTLAKSRTRKGAALSKIKEEN